MANEMKIKKHFENTHTYSDIQLNIFPRFPSSHPFLYKIILPQNNFHTNIMYILCTSIYTNTQYSTIGPV